jgi:hypothetical protein
MYAQLLYLFFFVIVKPFAARAFSLCEKRLQVADATFMRNKTWFIDDRLRFSKIFLIFAYCRKKRADCKVFFLVIFLKSIFFFTLNQNIMEKNDLLTKVFISNLVVVSSVIFSFLINSLLFLTFSEFVYSILIFVLISGVCGAFLLYVSKK